MDRRERVTSCYSPLENNKRNYADLLCSNENKEYREIVER